MRKAFLAELLAIVDSVVKQMLQEQDLEVSIETAKRPLSSAYSRRPFFEATVGGGKKDSVGVSVSAGQGLQCTGKKSGCRYPYGCRPVSAK